MDRRYQAITLNITIAHKGETMSKIFTLKNLTCAVALNLTALNAWAVDVPGSLVETDWLAANLKDVAILDVRKDLKSYDAAHIPGAVLINWKKVRVERQQNGYDLIKLVPNKAAFEAQMQAAGVNKDSAVVVVSKGVSSSDMTFATRLIWTFKYYGYDNVALLNGGTHKWATEKRDISTEAPKVTAGNFSISGKTRENIMGTEAEVKLAIDTGLPLIDGRTPEYFKGEKYKPSYVYKKGHIPGSVNVPHPTLFDKNDTTGVVLYKTADGLKKVFADAGIDASKPSMSYCNSGHYSTGHWFALAEILGNDKMASYDGSMHEWTKDGKNNPVKLP